jgi:hypothetical protein
MSFLSAMICSALMAAAETGHLWCSTVLAVYHETHNAWHGSSRRKGTPPGASLLGGGLRADDAGVRLRCHALLLPLCCGSVSSTAIMAACSQTRPASVALQGPGKLEVLWLHVPQQTESTGPAGGPSGTTTK